jgi:hypothetical protein
VSTRTDARRASYFSIHKPIHKMLHTVEVTGSNPVAPTIESITYRAS